MYFVALDESSPMLDELQRAVKRLDVTFPELAGLHENERNSKFRMLRQLSPIEFWTVHHGSLVTISYANCF